MSIDDKLAKVKYVSDEDSHIINNPEKCLKCKKRFCTFVCPAHVYEWDESAENLIINHENCLECGACRISCKEQSLEWCYPKGTKGVTFKLG